MKEIYSGEQITVALAFNGFMKASFVPDAFDFSRNQSPWAAQRMFAGYRHALGPAPGRLSAGAFSAIQGACPPVHAALLNEKRPQPQWGHRLGRHS
jgi:hypothetical protein